MRVTFEIWSWILKSGLRLLWLVAVGVTFRFPNKCKFPIQGPFSIMVKRKKYSLNFSDQCIWCLKYVQISGASDVSWCQALFMLCCTISLLHPFLFQSFKRSKTLLQSIQLSLHYVKYPRPTSLIFIPHWHESWFHIIAQISNSNRRGNGIFCKKNEKKLDYPKSLSFLLIFRPENKGMKCELF